MRRRSRPVFPPACLGAFLLLGIALAPSPAAAEPNGEVRADLLASGLDRPLFAAAPAGDPRLFVVERDGRVRIVKQGQVLATPFLHITAKVSTTGEGGLLGMAFPDDFAASGLFYVYYTDLDGDSVISRFAVGADPDVALPAEEVVFHLVQPRANHNGGTIAFGPDGFLWFSPGDGGGANDPDERAQDPQDLLGKMLRLDVGPSFAPGSIPVAGKVYRIPADNPFVGDAAVRDEIWALGLRNPYRFSFDRETGDLWIADVGQAQREEIDFEPAGDPGGHNYGWDVMEGSLCNTNDPAPAPPCNDPSLTLPIHEYPHTEGNCSITGGYVHRDRVTPLTGLYFFGDYCTGRVWTLDPDTLAARDRTVELGAAGGVGFALVGFGEDGAGRLHMVHQNGNVWRLRPADPACSDGIDNDGDGLVDLDDPGCKGNPLRNNESARCGLGFEIALLLWPLHALHARRRARRPHA